MKTILPLLSLCTLLTGCCGPYPYPPQGNCYPMALAGQSIVNNSGFLLDVFQDGVLIGRNLGVGQVLPVRPTIFQKTTVIVVTGHSVTGDYVGSAKYIFAYNVPEAWSVDRLYQPKIPQ